MSSLNDPRSARPSTRERIAEIVATLDDDFSRRRFLQLMGASSALAAAAGCRFEEEEILPFERRPDGRVPGTSRHFTTALELGGVAQSLLVTSYDGRPIKVEGNPLHPLDRGAASVRAQASVLDLYDPDASGGLAQTHDRAVYPRTFEEFDPWFATRIAEWRASGGEGLRVLAEPSSSRTFAALRRRFEADFPKARFVDHDPVGRHEEVAGSQLAFGRALRPVPKIDAAKVVLCLDADLLDEHPAALPHARAFAAGRDPDREMSRWWVVESTLTPTGAMADHRLALRAEQVLPFLLELDRRLGGGGGESAAFLAEPPVRRFLDALVEDLRDHGADALVAVGPRQPAAVHALSYRLLERLGALGRTLVFHEAPADESGAGVEPLRVLVEEMRRGEVKSLIVLGGNPVHDAPDELDFGRALRSVPESFHLSRYRDETSRACTWHLPRAHFLESWGDCQSWDGTRCTVQPLIDPLFPRRSPVQLVAALVGERAEVRDLVRAAIAPDADDSAWQRALHDGFVAGSAKAVAVPKVASFAVPEVSASAAAAKVQNGSFELVLRADPRLREGQAANNAWLQELPDATTKLCWGNALECASATAHELGVSDGDVVRVTVGERALEVPVVVVPGHAEGSFTLTLGHGRSEAGVVGGSREKGIESVGHDGYRLRTSATLYRAGGVKVERTGRSETLTRTQLGAEIDEIGTEGMEHRLKELVPKADLEHYREHEDFAKHAVHHPPLESLWTRRDPDERRWGMTIDLGACIGCNACTIACQAENNIPVVGREQVQKGREMHWLRIDRYFERGLVNPETTFQPLTCQHCESAPCEQVCPVGATMHSSEGLNDMVYNRCIGTRYCANNCPFKVRRFNFFNYHKQLREERQAPLKMLHNPEVTVRARGVMEKCTFCVQRIQAAKIAAKNAGRPLTDGEVVPACAQTCPTRAITFGDLADPRSAVAKKAELPRAYGMLRELNLRPRTSYLAKVHNPHPALRDHDDQRAH